MSSAVVLHSSWSCISELAPGEKRENGARRGTFVGKPVFTQLPPWNPKALNCPPVSKPSSTLLVMSSVDARDSNSHSRAHPPIVYNDSKLGVVCSVTTEGEVVCEGTDEGPHFNPPSPAAKRAVGKLLKGWEEATVLIKNARKSFASDGWEESESEDASLKSKLVCRQGGLCEGKDES